MNDASIRRLKGCSPTPSLMQGCGYCAYAWQVSYKLVRMDGFEPPAKALEGLCSILLSYTRMN